jgi:hypothetical protein
VGAADRVATIYILTFSLAHLSAKSVAKNQFEAEGSKVKKSSAILVFDLSQSARRKELVIIQSFDGDDGGAGN